MRLSQRQRRPVAEETESDATELAEGDDLAIILNAYRFHPQDRTRKALGEAIQEWVSKLGPSLSRAQVEDVIDETRGTVVEPFWLEDVEREIAVALVLAWSSSKVKHLGIRIVSADTLHTNGGLVFDRSGDHHYTEAFLYGAENSLSSPYFFAPSLMRPPSDVSQAWKREVSAELIIDEDGGRVTLDMSRPEFQHRAVLRLAQDSARALGHDIRLGQMGVRFGSSVGGMSLSTGSTESLIRFIALCEEREQIQIDWNTEEREAWSCVIDLKPAETERQPVRAALYRTTHGPHAWINLPLEPVGLSPDLYATLAEWTVPHVSWAPTLRKLENEAE